MTGVPPTLLRRLHWFLACLLLFAASPPPSPAFARDATAFVAEVAPSRPTLGAFRAVSPFAKPAVARDDAVLSREAPPTPALATSPRQIDRRYLYLELVTFLS